jgi:hypothetical protein
LGTRCASARDQLLSETIQGAPITNDQTLNLQLDSLKVAGCEKIFPSGTKSADTSALGGLPGAPGG